MKIKEAAEFTGLTPTTIRRLNDIARFMDSTRYMIIFEVLIENYPVADKSEKVRLYLTDTGYQNALQSQKRGEIKIMRHARVSKGELLYN
jgi:hypothetical protein